MLPNDGTVYFYSYLHCRYLVICYPMKAQYISTVSRARRIILLVWVSAITLAVVPAYFVEHKVFFRRRVKLIPGFP